MLPEKGDQLWYRSANKFYPGIVKEVLEQNWIRMTTINYEDEFRTFETQPYSESKGDGWCWSPEQTALEQSRKPRKITAEQCATVYKHMFNNKEEANVQKEPEVFRDSIPDDKETLGDKYFKEVLQDVPGGKHSEQNLELRAQLHKSMLMRGELEERVKTQAELLVEVRKQLSNQAEQLKFKDDQLNSLRAKLQAACVTTPEKELTIERFRQDLKTVLKDNANLKVQVETLTAQANGEGALTVQDVCEALLVRIYNSCQSCEMNNDNICNAVQAYSELVKHR